jgi:hypothetical protein
MGDQTESGWEDFKTDVDRKFSELESELDAAF